MLTTHAQFRNDKVIYRRYAGLYFCVCVDSNDNELAYLEAIHLFVEVLGEFCVSLAVVVLVALFVVVLVVVVRRVFREARWPPDAFFQNVCELDLVFSFYKVYAILDEVFLAGEIEETSKQVVLDRLDHLEKLE
jgi:AP-2 complex subunit sigma-1